MKTISYEFNDSLVDVSLSSDFVSHMKREISICHMSNIDHLQETDIEKIPKYNEFFNRCKKADYRRGAVHYVSGKIIEVQRERTTQMTQNVEANSTASTWAYASKSSSGDVSCSVDSTLKTKVNVENTSYNQQYQDIFIRDDGTGKEYHFRLIDSDILFRTGNTATFAWLDICDDYIGHSLFFLIKNHDTGKEFYKNPLDLYVMGDGKADIVGWSGLIFSIALISFFHKELIFSSASSWIFARSLLVGSLVSSILVTGMQSHPKKRTVCYYALLVATTALCLMFPSVWMGIFPVADTGMIMHSLAFIVLLFGILSFLGHIIVAFSPDHDAKVKEEKLKALERKKQREEYAEKIWENVMDELRASSKS